MPEIPRIKFNSPWTVENIETELNGVKTARGNGTLTEALDAKQNELTFDSVPTEGSTNPVYSGGIWTDQQRQDAEIDTKKDNKPTVITATSSNHANLNDFSLDGTFISRASSTSQYIDNCPVKDAGFVLKVYDLSIGTGATCIQEIIDTSATSNRIYTRRKTTGGWTVWCVITGSPVVSA